MQMHRTVSLVSGAGIGAGLIYFFDPDRRRRRESVENESHLWPGETEEADRPATRDTRSHAIGTEGAVKIWVQPMLPDSDRALAERVRAKVGQISRHPSAIGIQATDGTVTVSGPVLEDEFDGICNAIARIPGVAQIFNRLERHRTPDVPELHGPQERKPRSRLIQSNWSPSARTAAALMGTAAILYGASRRTAAAATVAASGLGLLVRSVTNQEIGKR